MRRLRFLVEAGALERGRGSRVGLPAEEARHLRVSLRGAPGETVHVFDGEGREFAASVVLVSPDRVEVELLAEETDRVEAPLRLVLLQAVSRDDAFESVIAQATALGAASIVPLLVGRTKGGSRPPDPKRLARWRRIARESAKLSWRRIVPSIEPPAEIAAAADLAAAPGARGLVLDPLAAAGVLHGFLARTAPAEVRVAVGPEGGFTADERDAFARGGFAPVSLGPRVLRTEHAGPAALAVLLSRWGDLG